MQYALVILLISVYLGAPVVLFMGLRRWLRRPSPQGLLSIFPLAGFVLGSASAVLAVGTVLHALTAGGFRLYDPTLLKIYRAGVLLALGGFALALIGVWGRNPLRWHAPALSWGMLVLWLIWASGE